ncbi:hypothetical protein ACQKMD_16625 [Viridibacillus sp. NPDC096237]|uniref:hypothetical protein n=1 Tax=Viridibacillus sp. NPDC096237 TaxID=3390721 RepID=UPI003CFCDE69
MKKSKNNVATNPDRDNKYWINKRLTRELYEHLKKLELITQLTPNAQTEILLTLMQQGLVTDPEFAKIAGVLSNNNLHPDSKILVGYEGTTAGKLVKEFRDNIKREGVDEYLRLQKVRDIIKANIDSQKEKEELEELRKEKERLQSKLENEQEEHDVDTEIYIDLEERFKVIVGEYENLSIYIKSMEVIVEELEIEKGNLEVTQDEMRDTIVAAAETITEMENNNRALHQRIDELTNQLNKKVSTDGLEKLPKEDRKHVIKTRNALYKTHTKEDVDNIVRLIANSNVDTQAINLYIRTYRKSKRKVDLLPVVSIKLKEMTKNQKYIATNIYRENKVICQVYDTVRNKVLDKDYLLRYFISNVCDVYGIPYSSKTLDSYITAYSGNYIGFDVNSSLSFVCDNHYYVTATSPHNYFTSSILRGIGAASVRNQLEDSGISSDFVNLKEIELTLDKEKKDKLNRKYRACKWYRYTDLLEGVITNYKLHNGCYNKVALRTINKDNVLQFEHFKKHGKINGK